MIRSAGDSSIDMAMAWAPRFNEFGDVEMYLFDGFSVRAFLQEHLTAYFCNA